MLYVFVNDVLPVRTFEHFYQLNYTNKITNVFRKVFAQIQIDQTVMVVRKLFAHGEDRQYLK